MTKEIEQLREILNNFTNEVYGAVGDEFAPKKPSVARKRLLALIGLNAVNHAITIKRLTHLLQQARKEGAVKARIELAKRILATGFNEDCLFCGLKDKRADAELNKAKEKEVAKEVIKGMKPALESLAKEEKSE